MAYTAAQPYPSLSFEVKPPPNPTPLPPPFNPTPLLPTQPPFSSSSAAFSYPPPTAVSIESPDFSQHYHLHHQVHHQHPSMHPPVPMVHANPEQQNIHTLFVSGLPDDVKAREIHNLFRRRQGFDFCQLKYTGRGNQVVAFATFFNHQSAMAAMDALNGMIFDPQSGATLRIELARSNSRIPRGGGEAYAIIDKRVKVTNDDKEPQSNEGDGGSDESPGTENDNSSNKGALNAVSSGGTAVEKENAQTAPNKQLEKPFEGDTPPCPTLFIANLGPTCTEEELKQVLSKYAGFHRLKMQGKGGMPVAFADFMDVGSSTVAMNDLQGTLLVSSDRGGMHLEYARSKMRKT